MEEDEATTVRTLKAHREVMTSLIQRYHGRLIDLPGANPPADFSSVVEAVKCAAKILNRACHHER